MKTRDQILLEALVMPFSIPNFAWWLEKHTKQQSGRIVRIAYWAVAPFYRVKDKALFNELTALSLANGPKMAATLNGTLA